MKGRGRVDLESGLLFANRGAESEYTRQTCRARVKSTIASYEKGLPQPDRRNRPGGQAGRSRTRTMGYPNPLSTSTRLDFSLAEDDRAVVRVFDAQGRLVRTLLDQDLAPGSTPSSGTVGTTTGWPLPAGRMTTSWSPAGHATGEDELDLVRTSQVQVLPEDLLKEDPSHDGPVQGLGQRKLRLQDGDVVVVARPAVLSRKGRGSRRSHWRAKIPIFDSVSPLQILWRRAGSSHQRMSLSNGS
jgi:hypothetical protein